MANDDRKSPGRWSWRRLVASIGAVLAAFFLLVMLATAGIQFRMLRSGNQTAAIGQPFAAGDFEFTITDITEDQQLITSCFPDSQHKKLVSVEMRATNSADSAKYHSAGSWKLVHGVRAPGSSYTSYESSYGATKCLDQGLWRAKVDPGASVTGRVGFILPADAYPERLLVSGGLFTKPVEVALT